MTLVVAAGLLQSAAAASGATLSGTVSGQSGDGQRQPVSGALVQVIDPQSGDVVAVGTTGFAGEYSIGVAPSTYRVRFDPGPGQLWGSTTVDDIDVSSDRVLDVVLILTGLVRVSGVVRDAAGLPVAGVSVSAAGGSGRTAADGSYSINAIPGTGRSVAVSAGGLALLGLPESWSLRSSPFELQSDAVRDFVLPSAVRVTVRVLGVEDEPLEGVEVRVPELELAGSFGGVTGHARSGGGKYLTDANGEIARTVFGGDPLSSSSDVRPPQGSGYGSTTYAMPPFTTDTTVVVRPPRLVRVSGVVRDAGGAAVAGARVAVGDGIGVSASDGSYSVETAPAEAGRLTVGAGATALPGLPSAWSLRSSFLDLRTDVVRDVTLPSTAHVTVRVLGVDDEPLEGVQVRIPSFSLDGQFGDVTGTLVSGADGKRWTDADGEVSTATFGGVQVGSSQEVRPPVGSGYGTTSYAMPPVTGDTTFVVRPPRQVRVTGFVRDAAGSPVAGASVSVTDGSGTTAADGSYAIVATPGAARRLTVSGGPSMPGSVVSSPFALESDTVVDVDFPPLRLVTVRTLGDGDEPLAGVEVRIPTFELSGTFGQVTGLARSGGGKYLTDADGEVSRLVFGGEPQSSSNDARPPLGSGYGEATYAMPTVTGDTTVVLRFQSANADLVPPAIDCAAPPGDWQADNVSLRCTASDLSAGLSDPSDAHFDLATHVPEGSEDADAETDTREVCDRAGNCAVAGPIGGIRVDRQAPRIRFVQEPNGLQGWFVDAPGSTTAVADDSTIASLTCTRDGMPVLETPVAGFGSLSLVMSAATEGRHAVECRRPTRSGTRPSRATRSSSTSPRLAGRP
ncbi:MAG TPA: carboxypeptidase-like regulatory domain-containing protein [Thermoleophilaceae bacterium]|nr:carboxypeptidase-like regulatory domain-containing protein [Thermoleophilaceae bacterium]